MSQTTRKQKVYQVTYRGFVANILLMIFKLIAGVVGKSTAMIADAIHSFSDFVSDIVVIAFVGAASKPVDDNHRYGHGKFETFATLIVGIILFFVGAGICWNGSYRIFQYLMGEALEPPHYIAMIAAIISIIVKESLFWYTYKAGKKVNSQLVIANAWHHRSDAFSSIATLIGITGAIFLGKVWVILDPIAAIFVSFFIFKVAYEIFLPAFNELLEQSLPIETRKEIITIVSNIEHVHNPSNLRTRNIGNVKAIEIHVMMNKNMTVEESHKITMIIEKKLKEHYGQETHVIVHVEPYEDNAT